MNQTDFVIRIQTQRARNHGITLSKEETKELDSMLIALDYRQDLIRRAAELLRQANIPSQTVGMVPTWNEERNRWLRDAGMEDAGVEK